MLRSTLLLLALAVPSGCVSRDRYDEAVKSAEDARAAARADAEASRAELERLTQALRQAEERGASDDTLAELAELRKQKAKVEARLRLFEDFVRKFRKMIDAGRLKIVVRRGRIVLVLSTDVLFDVAKTEIMPDGAQALKEIAATLRTVAGRRFQIVGHTDSAPIRTDEFPSNWELSSARALQVLHFLVKRGVRPQTLSAAGYGQHDPVASNANSAGRAKNRRIEITLVPDIEDLIALPVAQHD
jgi:chemotaxis protein MotB